MSIAAKKTVLAKGMTTETLKLEIRLAEHEIDMAGADSVSGKAAQDSLHILCAELGRREEC